MPATHPAPQPANPIKFFLSQGFQSLLSKRNIITCLLTAATDNTLYFVDLNLLPLSQSFYILHRLFSININIHLLSVQRWYLQCCDWPGRTEVANSNQKVFVFAGPTQNGLTGPRLRGSDIEKLLCIHYIHIISIISGLNLEMIEQVLSSLGFLTQC